MSKPDFSKLVDKYLNGECSPDEEMLLEKFLDSYQSRDQEWVKSELGDKQIINEKIYARVKNNLDSENKHSRYRYASAYKFAKSPYLLKIAASIIFLIIISTSLLYVTGVFNKKPDAITWNEKVTTIGKKSILTLFDGTKITLNADSKFKYPENFGSETREVHLEGEAYFEVSHNPGRPFIVHSGQVSTTVLGTKFNVKAFPSDKEIAVSLIEGKVKISIDEKEERLLDPKQQLSFNKTTGTEQVKKFDSMKAIGWKDNILVFDNDPLEKVLRQLQRTFGVAFELQDTAYAGKKIKATFNNESFWTVVKVIKSATGLKHKTVEENNELKKIIFYKE